MSCVFCAIVAGEAPAIRIYEDDDYLAILDIRPFTRGHTLVIPKRHTVDLTDTPPDTVAGMVRHRSAHRPGRAASRGCMPTATTSSSTTARPPSSPCPTSICTFCRGSDGDKLSFAKGMLLRRDPDREESGRLLREALAQLDAAEKTERMTIACREGHRAYRAELHDAIYQGTNGWIGHRLPGAPAALLLHTVGAKTGKARTTSLTYARDGDDYLVVASKGGDPRAPGWYHNLRPTRTSKSTSGQSDSPSRRQPVVPEDPDYSRLWRIVNKNNSDRYSGYQKRTTRPIPVVGLTPLEQLLGQQLQRGVAGRRGRRIGAAARRCDGVDHHLVDAEFSASART